MAVAAVLAVAWWLVTRPVAAPVSPIALAREGLPHLLARVQAEPRSVEARLDLAACYTLLSDRLGAWQQLCVAESLGGAPDAVRRMRARTAEALGQYDDAAGAAERAWRSSPNDLQRTLELHRLLTLQADFARALTIAREALARHPADPDALAAAGEAAFNVARYSEAIRRLKAARAAAPGRPDTAVKLGLALIRGDRGQEAVPVLNEVVRAPAAPPQAWEFLGQAQLSVGQTAAAAVSFRRAEEAGALGGGAAFGQALAALAQKRPAEAETALVRALARDPAHEPAAITLAQLLRSRGRRAEGAAVRARSALALGETAEAVAGFREAAALAPREVKRWRELARALEAAEDGPGALAALRRAQSLAPDDADLAAQQIETALAVFSPQEALRGCQRYAALSPTTADTEWWRFRAYRQLQDTARARAALQAAVAAGPERPEFLTWQGRTLLEGAPDASQVAAAERYLRRALELRPTDVEILGPLAEVSTRQQRWEEAGALLRRALAIDPDRGPGPQWLQLARVDRALGRTMEARWDTERYRRATNLRAEVTRLRAEATAHPRDGARRAAWAQAALRAGRLTEARAAARSAIRLAPSDPRGYQALAAACQRLGRLEDRIVAMEAARRVSGQP